MKVAMTGLKFRPKGDLIKLDFRFPKGTQILSVSAEKEKGGNEYVLGFSYLAPSDAYNKSTIPTYPWQEFHFYIVKCNYTEIEIKEHKYVGTVNIFNGMKNYTYAVFYETGAIVNN